MRPGVKGVDTLLFTSPGNKSKRVVGKEEKTLTAVVKTPSHGEVVTLIHT